MKWIGLTGGLGSGKSTVAKILRAKGCSVVDADELAHRALEKGSAGLKLVEKEFGTGVIGPDGNLDRVKLAKIVFHDPDRLKALEGIVHPIVRTLAEEEKQKWFKKGQKFLFYDVPLLFEKKMEPMFDAVVVVATDEISQIDRAKKRNSWSEEEIEKRLSQQIPILKKVIGADFVVQNTSSLENLEIEVNRLIEWAKKL